MSKSEEVLITYCGFCCLDCHSFTQKIPNLAEELIKELEFAKYQKFVESISTTPVGKAFTNYRECRNGGGNPECKIRICSKEKGYEGCWECEIFEKCETLDAMIPEHEDGHIKNLRIIKEKGKSKFLVGKRHW